MNYLSFLKAYLLLFTGFLLVSILSRPANAQNRLFSSFRDYIIPAANPDSLVRHEPEVRASSEQYLHHLIALEYGLFYLRYPQHGQHLPVIRKLAAQQRSQLGMAMAEFLTGINSATSNHDSLAYFHLTRAAEIFKSRMDTTGLIHCYRPMARILIDLHPVESKKIFDQKTILSQKSTYPLDRLAYYQDVARAHTQFDKPIREADMVAAFEKANQLIDRYPYLRFFRHTIYQMIQGGYIKLKMNRKGLEYAKRAIAHPQIEADHANYYTLGALYFRLGQYDSCIVSMQNALTNIHVKAPDRLRKIIDTYTLMMRSQAALENFEASYQTAQQVDSLKQVLNADQRDKALLDIQAKYDSERKKAELERLSLQMQLFQRNNQLLNTQLRSKEKELEIQDLAMQNKASESEALLLRTRLKQTEHDMQIGNLQREKEKAEFSARELRTILIISLVIVAVISFLLLKLRRSNAQLRELQTGRDKLYTIIAHDLRMPINSLSNVGPLLRYLIAHHRMEDVDRVANQIEHMNQQTNLLLSNLLEWGKSTYFSLQKSVAEKQNIVPLLQTIYDTFLPFTEAKGVKFTATIPDELELTTDKNALALTLRNLLDNALKNTASGDRIIFSAHAKPQAEASGEASTAHGAVISICDTGKGISPAKLTYLKEIFAGNQKAEPGVEELGLGIALVQMFIQKNKATVTIDSQPGQGTLIHILL